MSEKKSFFDDPPSASGNIWGWKFSMISLVIILLFAALAYFRWVQVGKPSMREAPPTEQSTTPPPQ
ncbi:MAG: hypothetical protein WA004_03165 [Saprospiraceae bacterium]